MSGTRGVAAIFLWGGFGSRQRMVTRRVPSIKSQIANPYFVNTNAVPKPLMPVAAVPMSRIAVEKLRAIGVTEMYATTHNLHEVIEYYYMDMEGPGRELGISQLWREDVPLGTAPGLVMNLMLRASLREKTIVAPSGDIISDLDMAEAIRYHQESGSLCTIALNAVPEWEVKRFGTAHLIPESGPFGRIDGFKEKKPPAEALRSQIGGRDLFLNNSSFYIFEPSLFLTEITFYKDDGTPDRKGTLLERIFPHIDRAFLERIKKGEIDVKSQAEAETYFELFGACDKNFSDFGGHIFPQLAKNGLMHGYCFDRYWNDVGDNETYWFANWHALAGRFSMNIPYPQVAPGYWRDPTAQVISPELIIPPVILGRNVHVESGTVVGPFAIIGDGWTLESGVEFKLSIAWPMFARPSEYPRGLALRIIREGAVIEKSLLAGQLPIGDLLHKAAVGDAPSRTKNKFVRTVTSLKMAVNSEATVAKQTRKVLIVEDDQDFLDPILETLRKEGWERVEVARTFAEASEKLASIRYDAIILDSILDETREPEIADGVLLLKGQKDNEGALNHDTPILFWSSHESERAHRGLGRVESSRLVAEKKVREEGKDNSKLIANISNFILTELLGIKLS